MESTNRSEAHRVAELSDLLQLDHDAVQAYTVAIESMESAEHRETLVRFRADHERHVENLTGLIRAHGGIPIELPHIPTGLFKLAVQKAGAAGGDRAILLAFKANEGQVRDKYMRLAERETDPQAREILMHNASDEQVHYRWVSGVLEEMGAGAGSTAGRVESAFEKVHGGAADVMENVERRVMEKGEFARREVLDLTNRTRDRAMSGLDRIEQQISAHPMTTIVTAVGVGLLIGRALR